MSVSGHLSWQWTQRGARHLVYAMVACITYFVVGQFDYQRLSSTRSTRNAILWLTAVSAFCCVIVLIPHIGLEVNGARRWLPLGPIQLQPSELANGPPCCFWPIG